MKCAVHVPAFASHGDTTNTGPTDPFYEARCIALDAERAWRIKEPLERALSWEKGTPQYLLWITAYNATAVRLAREASAKRRAEEALQEEEGEES